MKKIIFILLLGLLALPTTVYAKFNNLCQAESDSDLCKKLSVNAYQSMMNGFMKKEIDSQKSKGKNVDLKAIQQEASEFIPYDVFVEVFNKCGEEKTKKEDLEKCLLDLFGDRAVMVISKKYQNKTK